MTKQLEHPFKGQFTKQHWDEMSARVNSGYDYMDYNHYAQMKDSIDQIITSKELTAPMDADFTKLFEKLESILVEEHFDETERLPREEIFHLKNYFFEGHYKEVLFKTYLSKQRQMEKEMMKNN